MILSQRHVRVHKVKSSDSCAVMDIEFKMLMGMKDIVSEHFRISVKKGNKYSIFYLSEFFHLVLSDTLTNMLDHSIIQTRFFRPLATNGVLLFKKQIFFFVFTLFYFTILYWFCHTLT